MTTKKDMKLNIGEINEYLDEIAATIDLCSSKCENCRFSANTENGVEVIEEKIDTVRDLLNELVVHGVHHSNDELLLRTSRILDNLLNIYYRKSIDL
jgi:hypothetical protein